jgi:hypothetical protein
MAESVIPAEASRFIPAPTIRSEFQGAFPADETSKKNPEAYITNGGLGNLNIAELNARAGVKQQGDEEFLARLQGILDELKKRAGEEGEEMAVDS